MKKIIYGLLTIIASSLVLLGMGASAMAQSSQQHELAPVFNVAFYFASSRYQSTNANRVSDYYRTRHKYRNGHTYRHRNHQRTRYAKQKRRRPPPPAVVKPVAKIASTGKPTFVFNPSQLNWGAYDAQGNLLNFGRASGGRDYCADIRRGCRTPIGSFSLYRKGGPGCVSSKFPLGKGGAPMGYCMFFRGGYAIHASNNVPGHNASHGCIRVVPSAARWLSKEFMRIGTKVVVRGY